MYSNKEYIFLGGVGGEEVTQVFYPDPLSGKGIFPSYGVSGEPRTPRQQPPGSATEHGSFTQGPALPRLPASSYGHRCVRVRA